MTQLKPATGSFRGSIRMSSRRNMVRVRRQKAEGRSGQSLLPSAFCPLTYPWSSLRPLQLQPDIDEVIRRPRSRVEEPQFVLVLFGDLGDLVVEGLRLLPLDEEGGVHDHLVADGLVWAGGDGGVAQRLVDLADVRVGFGLQGRLDHAAELHP